MEAPVIKNRQIFNIVSPSSGTMASYPNRVKTGIKVFENAGYRVEFAAHALGQADYLSGSIEERVADLQQCFESGEAAAILTSIGGYNCNQLLSLWDFECIAQNPRILCGYSDITALLLAIYVKTHLTVFHGPCFLTEFCEYPHPLKYTWDNFFAAVRGEAIEWQPTEYFTTEFYDWALQEQQMYRRKLKQPGGWTSIRYGSARGTLIGGNLRTIVNMIGTEYLPVSTFDGALLFIEDCACSLAIFDSLLYALKHHKVWEHITGLVIGRFNTEIGKNEMALCQVLLECTRDYSFPIIIDVDLGHTDPMITIPIGRCGYLVSEPDNTIQFGVEGLAS